MGNNQPKSRHPVEKNETRKEKGTDALAVDIFFEQLPHEINVMILNLLDLDTVLKSGAVCKRWLNNVKCVEHLDLCLTTKPIHEEIEPSNRVYTKRVPTRLANIDWKPLEAILKRFHPENLRSLYMYPDTEAEVAPVKNFVARAVNLSKLHIIGSWYMNTVLFNYPPDILKDLTLDFLFLKHWTHFTNLERLQFSVNHSGYEPRPFDYITKLGNLKSLIMLGPAQKFLDLAPVGRLTHLKELRLDGAYLEDGQFSIFAGLTNLERLEMKGLQKEIPLEDLDVSDVPMFEIGNHNPVSGIRHLTKLVNLTYLDISHVQPTYDNDGNPDQQEGYDIAHLVKKHFTKLKSIDITNTELGGNNREKLKAIPWLNVIDAKE